MLGTFLLELVSDILCRYSFETLASTNLACVEYAEPPPLALKADEGAPMTEAAAEQLLLTLVL